MHLRLAAASLLFVTACASPPAILKDFAPADTALLLLGEQHDAASHQRLQREVVQALASRGQLAALALEMTESGTSTAGLPARASEEEVRRVLRWDGAGWPWAAYGPAVMAAVAAGVPVTGANLPRERMRAAMADSSLDAALPGPALKAQQQAIRNGHCGLLPESQIAPMARVQIARDRAMASILEQLTVPGKTVVLIAGGGHADPALGIPLHLPAGLRSRSVILPPEPAQQDYCAQLRGRLKDRSN